MAYVEKDCTIEHEGKKFTSGGAVVTVDYAVGYMMLDLSGERIIADWHGIKLGYARIVASWAMPFSYVSSTMHQVEAVIDGRRYTGRCAGNGMIWKGKRKV